MSRYNFVYLSLFFSGKDWIELSLYSDSFMDKKWKKYDNAKYVNASR